MDQQALKNVLELHRKWVMNEDGGVGAVLRSADLRSAVLRSADLRSAVLSGAVLSSADLSGADLRSAVLSGADLSGADLSGADLRSADLRSAVLSGADLRSADLRSADLRSADLSGADLRSADLRSADLSDIKADFFEVLAVAPTEVLGLYDALMRGRIDGSHYEGDCACLVGTIANIRHENYEKLSIALKPDSSRLSEKWFMAIEKDSLPQSNAVSGVTAEWMREWMDAHSVKYPKYEIVAIDI